MHPDLYELDALGEMIRIDAIRELRRDLHMRPFEADRRVYLLHRAHLMNEDAADALLKDLEEPPSYAVIVLIADDLGPLPETIRSRCQLVAFSRLSEKSIRALVDARAPELDEAARAAIARVSAGRLDRLERLLDPAAATRREHLIDRARAVYRDPQFDASEAASTVLAHAQERATEARETEEARIAELDLPAREAEQRVRRAARGAEREELLAQLEELGAWYRDLVAVAVGADRAAIHLDKLPALREDATRERVVGAERAAEAVREAWRALEEFNRRPNWPSRRCSSYLPRATCRGADGNKDRSGSLSAFADPRLNTEAGVVGGGARFNQAAAALRNQGEYERWLRFRP